MTRVRFTRFCVVIATETTETCIISESPSSIAQGLPPNKKKSKKPHRSKRSFLYSLLEVDGLSSFTWMKSSWLCTFSPSKNFLDNATRVDSSPDKGCVFFFLLNIFFFWGGGLDEYLVSYQVYIQLLRISPKQPHAGKIESQSRVGAVDLTLEHCSDQRKTSVGGSGKTAVIGVVFCFSYKNMTSHVHFFNLDLLKPGKDEQKKNGSTRPFASSFYFV